jgi:uncharacterized protein (TIGR02996 family)
VTEDAFLNAIVSAPEDNSSLSIYADWLEEQGDAESAAKCAFLRLTVESVPALSNAEKSRWRRAKHKRLKALAAQLDTDWLRVVSRLRVEQCQGKGESTQIQWTILCRKRWEELTATPDRNQRFCEECQKHVHYCDSLDAARTHAAAGHCIAVDLRVARRKDDLLPEGIVRLSLGMADF